MYLAGYIASMLIAVIGSLAGWWPIVAGAICVAIGIWLYKAAGSLHHSIG